MRHLIKKWTSTQQLISTNSTQDAFASGVSVYHQQVPMIEEEPFFSHIDRCIDIDHMNDDHQGALFNIYIQLKSIDVRRFLVCIEFVTKNE